MADSDYDAESYQVHLSAEIISGDRGDIFEPDVTQKLHKLTCLSCNFSTDEFAEFESHSREMMIRRDRNHNYTTKLTECNPGVADGAFACTDCGNLYSSQAELAEHSMSMETSVKLICPQCQYLASDMEKHIAEHAEDKQCLECHSTDLDNLSQHMIDYHGGFASILIMQTYCCAGNGTHQLLFDVLISTNARFLASEVKPLYEEGTSNGGSTPPVDVKVNPPIAEPPQMPALKRPANTSNEAPASTSKISRNDDVGASSIKSEPPMNIENFEHQASDENGQLQEALAKHQEALLHYQEAVHQLTLKQQEMGEHHGKALMQNVQQQKMDHGRQQTPPKMKKQLPRDQLRGQNIPPLANSPQFTSPISANHQLTQIIDQQHSDPARNDLAWGKDVALQPPDFLPEGLFDDHGFRIWEKHRAKVHQCELCGFAARTKNKYREKQDHMLKWHFSGRIEFLFPLSHGHGKKNVCPVCHFEGKDRQNVVRHCTGKHSVLDVWLSEFLNKVIKNQLTFEDMKLVENVDILGGPGDPQMAFIKKICNNEVDVKIFGLVQSSKEVRDSRNVLTCTLCPSSIALSNVGQLVKHIREEHFGLLPVDAVPDTEPISLEALRTGYLKKQNRRLASVIPVLPPLSIPVHAMATAMTTPMPGPSKKKINISKPGIVLQQVQPLRMILPKPPPAVEVVGKKSAKRPVPQLKPLSEISTNSLNPTMQILRGRGLIDQSEQRTGNAEEGVVLIDQSDSDSEKGVDPLNSDENLRTSHDVNTPSKPKMLKLRTEQGIRSCFTCSDDPKGAPVIKNLPDLKTHIMKKHMDMLIERHYIYAESVSQVGQAKDTFYYYFCTLCGRSLNHGCNREVLLQHTMRDHRDAAKQMPSVQATLRIENPVGSVHFAPQRDPLSTGNGRPRTLASVGGARRQNNSPDPDEPAEYIAVEDDDDVVQLDGSSVVPNLNSSSDDASDGNEACLCKNCLNEDERKSSGTRSHPCYLNHDCGKTFKKKSHLIAHVRGFNNERPFVCEVESCAKSFIRKEELRRHAWIHSDEARFRCACGKGYARSDHYRNHTVKCPVVQQTL